MFRAVLFDLDDTLIDRAGALERYLVDLVARREIPVEDRPAAIDRLRQLDDRGYGDRARFVAAAARALPALGLDGPSLWRDFAPGIAAAVEPRPEVTLLVEKLAARGAIALVSNGSGAMQRVKLARAGLEPFFDDAALFISGELGYAKPDPRIFERALDHLGLGRRRGEVLLVGDDPEADIHGAGRLDISTAWLSLGRAWPDNPALRRPSFVLPGIEALAELLEA